jgi:hypothetical protein
MHTKGDTPDDFDVLAADQNKRKRAIVPSNDVLAERASGKQGHKLNGTMQRGKHPRPTTDNLPETFDSSIPPPANENPSSVTSASSHATETSTIVKKSRAPRHSKVVPDAEVKPTVMGYYDKYQQRIIDSAKKRMRVYIATQDGFPETVKLRDEATGFLFEVISEARSALVEGNQGYMESNIEVQLELLDELRKQKVIAPVVGIVRSIFIGE